MQPSGGPLRFTRSNHGLTDRATAGDPLVRFGDLIRSSDAFGDRMKRSLSTKDTRASSCSLLSVAIPRYR